MEENKKQFIITIRSGGQTGVDRGALDAAIEYNKKAEKSLLVNITGWCPKERWAEDGTIDSKYPLTETPSSACEERTEWNVRDAEATLVLLPNAKTDPGYGTIFTFEKIQELGKQRKDIFLDDDFEEGTEDVLDWIITNHFNSLNVAGPRESNCPGIYNLSHNFMTKLLEKIKMHKLDELKAQVQVPSK